MRTMLALRAERFVDQLGAGEKARVNVELLYGIRGVSGSRNCTGAPKRPSRRNDLRKRGFEPPLGCPNQLLRLARLPFRHFRSVGRMSRGRNPQYSRTIPP
jgi:hypothetical protein